jgi:hypothetical protein
MPLVRNVLEPSDQPRELRHCDRPSPVKVPTPPMGVYYKAKLRQYITAMDSTEAKRWWAIIKKVANKKHSERHPTWVSARAYDIEVTELDKRLCWDALQQYLTFYEHAAAVRHPPPLPFEPLPIVAEFWQELHNITNREQNGVGATQIRELKDFCFADGKEKYNIDELATWTAYHITLNQPTKMLLAFVDFFSQYHGTRNKPPVYHTIEQLRETEFPVRLQINAVLKYIIALGADVNVDFFKLDDDLQLLYYEMLDNHMDFIKILLENGADQYKTHFLEEAFQGDGLWHLERILISLRDDFHPEINYMDVDVELPYRKEDKISEYVGKNGVPHPQSLLMMAIEGRYNEWWEKDPSDEIMLLGADYFVTLLNAGAHPFLNDIKKYTNKDGFVVKEEAVYNPKKPTAKDTLLARASSTPFIVKIPISGDFLTEEMNRALVRAFTIPLSAILHYDTPTKEKEIINVLAHNEEKAREMTEQMTKLKEEYKRSFHTSEDDSVKMILFDIGPATIVTKETHPKQGIFEMPLYHYNQYAAAWRKFNKWKAAHLNMLYEHTVDYAAQPFSTFWPLLLTYGRKLTPTEVRHRILYKYDLSDDLTDKNNIQQMRHYLWETNKGFARLEFVRRHYLRENEAALNFAAEYNVRYDRLGNVSRALQEIQRMWHEDERLQCYGQITHWATKNVQANVRLRRFEWPSIPEIKECLGFHTKEHKRKEELTRIIRELQGRVDTLAETNIQNLMRVVPLEA